VTTQQAQLKCKAESHRKSPEPLDQQSCKILQMHSAKNMMAKMEMAEGPSGLGLTQQQIEKMV